jgi:hypothetical protein
VVTIVWYRLSFDIGNWLPQCAAFDPVEALVTHFGRLFEDFEGLEPGSTGKADEAFRVELFTGSSESYDSSFDGQLALVTGSSSSLTHERPVA